MIDENYQETWARHDPDMLLKKYKDPSPRWLQGRIDSDDCATPHIVPFVDAAQVIFRKNPDGDELTRINCERQKMPSLIFTMFSALLSQLFHMYFQKCLDRALHARLLEPDGLRINLTPAANRRNWSFIAAMSEAGFNEGMYQ